MFATTGGPARWWFGWRTHGAEDLRRVVVALRAVLTHAVAAGGAPSDLYETPTARRAQHELAELVGQVHDWKLRRSCRQVEDAYQRAWTASRPPATSAFTPVRPSVDGAASVRARERQRQVTHARQGLVAITAILARLGDLGHAST
jgi:hypothetical protein